MTQHRGHGETEREGHGHHDEMPGEESWQDEAFVASWLDRQANRATERRRQFAIVRAVIPKLPDDQFRYLNLGSGPGNLDEVLLEAFPRASATLVDFSLPMLTDARRRLARYGTRVDYIRADLGDTGWSRGVAGSFDLVCSTLALHHSGGPARVRALYAEVYGSLIDGGMLLNLDYVRPARPVLAALAEWAGRDQEAGLGGHVHDDLPGSVVEHLGWLREAGFGVIDVLWKDLNAALFCGIRGDLWIPEGRATG